MNSKLTFEARLKKHFTFGNKRYAEALSERKAKALTENPARWGRDRDYNLEPAPVNLGSMELIPLGNYLKKMRLWYVSTCRCLIFAVS